VSRLSRLEDGAVEAIITLEHLVGPSRNPKLSLLGDIMRRADYTSRPDGYPRSSGGAERVGGGDGSDPTIGTVLALVEDVCTRCDKGTYTREDGVKLACKRCGGTGRRWVDQVQMAADELVRQLEAIVRAVRVIEKKQQVVLGAGERLKGRQSSLQGSCIVCGADVSGVGSDRLVKGCCHRCYLSWTGYALPHKPSGDPGHDFVRFTTWRRSHLEVEDAGAEVERLRARRELPSPSRAAGGSGNGQVQPA
jgi:hypothetical protein